MNVPNTLREKLNSVFGNHHPVVLLETTLGPMLITLGFSKSKIQTISHTPLSHSMLEQEWKRLVLEKSMHGLEREANDEDHLVASKNDMWYMVGGFYWKIQDTTKIAPDTYGTLFRNPLGGEWKVKRIVEDQRSVEVEMAGGQKVTRNVNWSDFYVREFARPVYSRYRFSFVVAMAVMALHQDKTRILGRDETLKNATVWKDVQTHVSGEGWSTELLKKALSANFIDLHYALRKNPEFRLEDVERAPKRRLVFSSTEDAKPHLQALSFIQEKSSLNKHPGICWIHHDPVPVQNILQQDLNISTVALSHKEGLKKMSETVQKKKNEKLRRTNSNERKKKKKREATSPSPSLRPPKIQKKK